MKRVMIEFPIVGYAYVYIEVEDDMTSEEIIESITDGTIEVKYDGRSHTENLWPLLDIEEAHNLDIPLTLGVVE